MTQIGVYERGLWLEWIRRNMQKDIALKQLAEHEDVFAEVFNQLAFGGKNIITPGELTELPTEAIVMEMEGQLREKRRDIVKADRRGQCYHLIFDLENQDRIDYTMPVRIMGYEVASYEKQIREMAAINQKEDSHSLNRLKEGQRLAPVVSLILYWGKEPWEKPRCLHDMLEFSEDIEEVIKPLISAYPINLVDMSQLTEEERQNLTTDIRLLADYVAYRKDPYKRKNILRDMPYKIRHWKETLTALAAIAGDKRYTQMIKAWEDKIPQEDGEEEHDMCEMLEEIWSEAKEEGIKEGIKEGIGALIKLCKNFQVSRQETLQKILESFSLPQQEAEEYLAMYW